MDDKSFDRLTVKVSSAESRRSVLRAVLGTVLGSGFLGLSPDGSAATDTRQDKARRGKKHGRPRDGAPKQQRGEAQEQQPDPEQHDPIDDPALQETGDSSGEELAAASHGCGHAGTACTGGGQCCTGKCLSSGTCSCSATNRCTQPAEPCKKAICNDKKRCVIKNKARGSACPDDGNPCTKDVCDGNGQCIHPKKPNGTDCGTSQVCQDGVCPSIATCSDGVKNGGETDVDCGGPGGCPHCANGKSCRVNGDCASNHCCKEAYQTEGVCKACCADSHCHFSKVCESGSCVCGASAHDCDGDGLCETCGSGCGESGSIVCGQSDPTCGPDCSVDPGDIDPGDIVVGESGASLGIASGAGVGIGMDFCCAGGYCSCGGACCQDCAIDVVTEAEFCCSAAGGTPCKAACCAGECLPDGECPIGARLGSYRR
jgi:hypothetical protein